jgi:hypothetical protein
MSDNYEHNPGDHEDPLPGPTWIVGILGAVLLAVIVLGLTALFYNAQTKEDAKKIVSKEPDEIIRLRTEQTEVLTASPRLREVSETDAQGQTRVVQALAIPIDQAMQIIVNESK